MSLGRKARLFPVTMRVKSSYSGSIPSTTETDVVKTAVQDYFVAPFDCDLVLAQIVASSVAGTSAKAASLAKTVGGDALTISASTAGDAGNLLTVSLANSTALGVAASHTFASTGYTSKLSYKDPGTGGNGWKINLVSHSHSGGGVIINDDTTNKVFTIMFEEATSTRADINTAIGSSGSIVVTTAGSATAALTAAVDQVLGTTLFGGTVTCTATLTGTALAVVAKTGVATSAEVDAAISAITGFACTGGSTGTFSSITDTFSATALAGGAAAKPTVDIYVNGTSVFSDQVGVLVAGTVYEASFTDGQSGSRFERIKLSKNDKVTMRLTTTSSDGQMSNATASLLFEF